MNRFVAIDVETSNSDMASICQVGIVCYEDGVITNEWSSLINPQDYFASINVGIHGITMRDVEDAPIFSDVYETISNLISNTVCVSHTHFDRVSLDKVIRKYKLNPIETNWLDSARVARRAWEECAWKGYGLAKVCKLIGFDFKHHDALEDAKACGAVIIAASEKTELDLKGWLTRVGQPVDLSTLNSSSRVTRDGNSEGELYGQILVFTGALDIPRKIAADMASSIGCAVGSSVTKKTNYLVVGDQDVTKLAGKEKSSKHLKAETLIGKGVDIRILKESDFQSLVDTVSC